MEPSLHDGDELLYARLPPRGGSIVVARDPRDDLADRLVVKRVASIDGDQVILESDRPEHAGVMVDRSAVLGRVLLRYKRG
jgi:phage repressor protein C with HTH and peptisase S24 domain